MSRPSGDAHGFSIRVECFGARLEIEPAINKPAGLQGNTILKIYISADIEGTAGITHWDEAEKGKLGYDLYAELMTGEVVAACEGALAAGASEIVVKDAHWTARNILAERLPEQVRLIRGWSGHPWAMIQDLDDSFDALIMTGYHSGAGTGGQPLAHTMTDFAHQIRLNGEVASEFTFNRLAAATVGVPTVFLSGDQLLCDVARQLDPALHTVATMEGIGGSTNSMHPGAARSSIRESVETALGCQGEWKTAVVPEAFHLEIWCTKHEDAYKASFYPGVTLTAPHILEYRTSDFFEIMRTMHFVLKD